MFVARARSVNSTERRAAKVQEGGAAVPKIGANDLLIPFGLDAGTGNTGWYQYWYRDPGGGAGALATALSNAIELTFN